MVTAGFGRNGQAGRGHHCRTLQNAGVKHCYGVVGDTLNLIARSLEKSQIVLAGATCKANSVRSCARNCAVTVQMDQE
jgi:hypothetical protein